MKVIFLDIDGVMNSENHARELHKLVEEGKMTNKQFSRVWDLPYDGTALPLKKIVNKTGAIIVLSSSWRIGGWEGILVGKLIKSFEPYGLTISDLTCQGVSLERLKELGFNPDNCYDAQYRDYTRDNYYNISTHDRGAEIAEWLSHHEDVESFVILDDDWQDIEPYYKDNFVQTMFYDWGLTEELADKAIEILNKEKN